MPQFLCSQADILAGGRLETRLTQLAQLTWSPRYIVSLRTQQKTPFPNNPFLVACVFVAAGMCLPSRCLAMNVYSGSTIAALRRHVRVPSFLKLIAHMELTYVATALG
jgi:hypothetical protein